MQTPPAPQLTGGSVAAIPSPFDSFVMAVNANPYFIGFMMLALNLGGRFIGLELTRSQEAFLQNVWVRRLLIFVVLFMGTRNILVAFWMWLAVVFLLGYVLNENSSMCIFGTGLPGSKCASGSGGEGTEGFVPLTPEESQVYSILKAKAEKAGPAPAPAPAPRSVQPNERRQMLPKTPAPKPASIQGTPLPSAPTQGAVTSEGQPKTTSVNEDSFVDTYLSRMNELKEGYQNPRF
jgi:hypothetical protein